MTQTCTALIACLTVAPQAVLLVVPGPVHCHGKEQTEAICEAETAWREGRGSVVILPLHTNDSSEELK